MSAAGETLSTEGEAGGVTVANQPKASNAVRDIVPSGIVALAASKCNSILPCGPRYVKLGLMSKVSADLKDRAARERFITELEKNFCVSAGAGVGKTTAIVERVARLAAKDPKSLPRLVVVTYGKPAAEELKVRSRERILQQLRPSAHLRQSLLSDLRQAFFGTIHSFCLKLIQEQGRYLGLARTLDLLEESGDEELWARFTESSRLDACQFPGEALVLRFLSFDDLLCLARRLDPLSAERIKAEFVETPAPPLDFTVSLADAGGRSLENTAKHQEHLRQWLEDFEAGVPFLQLPDYTTGSGSFKEAFREELAPFAAWLGGLAGRIGAEIALAYRDYRLEKGFMTYADQILWCRKLIENEAVLNRLRERRYIVILDEAQDTDAEMFSILTEITRPRNSGIDQWPGNPSAAGPEAGRFSFVGDEQQAIYASRASLEVYSQYINAFKEGRGGENLEFSVTMRCPARVIKTVNTLFFAGGRMKQTCVDFRELLEKPDCKEGDSWLLALNPTGPDLWKVGDLFINECEQVAEFLSRFQLAGLGARSWSEIAILCPRHKWLAAAQQTFRRFDLPCRLVAEKKLDLELAHRSWPAALLYTLLNPWDRFELIGVLREIFAISDVDLADAYLLNGKRLTLNLTGHLSPPLANALSLLARLRSGIPGGKGTLSRYVDRVLEETRLEARLEATGNQPEGIQMFRFEAMQAECDGVPLRDWIEGVCRRLRQSSKADARGGDEMQLLTCMKAKGLEWPIVIPLGLGREIEDLNRPYPRIERQKVHLCSATIEPEAVAEAELRSREEYQRVLYVTLTRPKSILILPDSSALYKGTNRGTKETASNFLSLSKWRDLDHASFLQAPAARVAAQAATKEPEFSLHSEPPSSILEAAVRNSRAMPERILPHLLVSEQKLPDYLSDSYPATEIGGIDYGQWWHKTLERFPWAKGAGALDEYSRELKFPPLFQERAEREWTNWMRGDPCREMAAEGKNFLSEVPFSYPRSGTAWMEGVIDLVVVTRRDELWILDWKTDRLLAGEREGDFRARMRGHYAPQLAAYREVLENGMKRKVSRLVLYSTELASFIE